METTFAVTDARVVISIALGVALSGVAEDIVTGAVIGHRYAQ